MKSDAGSALVEGTCLPVSVSQSVGALGASGEEVGTGPCRRLRRRDAAGSWQLPIAIKDGSSEHTAGALEELWAMWLVGLVQESHEASVCFRGATPWWGTELDNSKSMLHEPNKRTERVGYPWHVLLSKFK